MKNVDINIAAVSFPNQFESDEVKETIEFGLQVGQAIQYEWFRKDGNQCRYYGQWRDFHKLRLYARAEQPIQKYKDELAVEGDLSYLNLDWTPVPIMPKFIDIVVNGLSERLFSVKAVAQDAMSQAKRSAFQDMLEGQAAAKDILEVIQQGTGANPFMMNPNDLPTNDEEVALYMQLHYKPAIEIAEEEGISTIFEENHYLDVMKRYNYDLAVIGIGIVKHQFLLGAGVVWEYVDPANVVYSYTEDPYFRDCFYWGEIKTLPITECLKIDPTLTKDDLKKIASCSKSWYDYYNVAQLYDHSIFNNDTVTLLYFNYKTSKTIKYKKKILENGGARVIEKADTFNPPADMVEEGRFEVLEKTIDVWYDGIMVMGSNILLKWELAKNMVRPKSASQHAIPNYVACAPRMYKGVIESLGKRMIPFVDLIQMTHLKLQQVTNRIVPDGVFIDADGLNEVDLGNGAAYNPNAALRLYFQTGSVIGRSYTQEGEFNNARIPIQELNHNSGANKLQALILNYNHYLDMIRGVTGLNEARDASTPDPRSLVGLQKLAALNSNTATRHILDGSLHIFKSSAEAFSYRIADILEYADFKDDFANKIGRNNVAILDEIKDLYLYDFGIFIEVEPDEEEKANLEGNIQAALAQKDINLEDAIDIRQIKNIKYANQMLKLRRIKKQQHDDKMAMQQQAMQAEGQMRVQQMANEAAMQKIEAQGMVKLKVEQGMAAFKMAVLEKEAALKSSLMQQEFEYNMQLTSAENSAITERDDMKEEGKAKRISQQNTEQSKLLFQRKNNLPPQRFESTEDTLDGLDLSAFGPR